MRWPQTGEFGWPSGARSASESGRQLVYAVPPLISLPHKRIKTIQQTDVRPLKHGGFDQKTGTFRFMAPGPLGCQVDAGGVPTSFGAQGAPVPAISPRGVRARRALVLPTLAHRPVPAISPCCRLLGDSTTEVLNLQASIKVLRLVCARITSDVVVCSHNFLPHKRVLVVVVIVTGCDFCCFGRNKTVK